MQEFVLPVRKGGLGNQMFQVAAAVIYAAETGKTILLPDEFYNSHKTLQDDYANSMFRAFPNRINKPIDDFAIQMLLRNGFQLYPGEPGFEDWHTQKLPGNIILHGYFQNYPPIARHEDTIRSLYSNALGEFLSSFQPSSLRLGLHVRRGDYLKPPHSDVLPVQNLDYYKDALSRFPISELEVYIFSDDIEWCKQQTLFQELPKKVFFEEMNELKTLACMTTCQAGFICANSSFSWWGAFLGAYALRRPIVVPKNWFKGGVGNLFPPEWIQL